MAEMSSNWATTNAPLPKINMHENRNTKRAMWYPPEFVSSSWQAQFEHCLTPVFRFSSEY
jgi:hypothetical protein